MIGKTAVDWEAQGQWLWNFCCMQLQGAKRTLTEGYTFRFCFRFLHENLFWLGVWMQTTAGKFLPLYTLECRLSALLLLLLLLRESVDRGVLRKKFLKRKV